MQREWGGGGGKRCIDGRSKFPWVPFAFFLQCVSVCRKFHTHPVWDWNCVLSLTSSSSHLMLTHIPAVILYTSVSALLCYRPLVGLHVSWLVGVCVCVFQAFQPLTGQAQVGGVAVVEFLSDRELEFYTETEELRPYEVCVWAFITFLSTWCVLSVSLCICGRVCVLGLSESFKNPIQL